MDAKDQKAQNERNYTEHKQDKKRHKDQYQHEQKATKKIKAAVPKSHEALYDQLENHGTASKQ